MKLLITGAGGSVATLVRPLLQREGLEVVLTSMRAEFSGLAPHESYISCDLCDEAAVSKLLGDVDGVIHLAGQATEASFETVFHKNLFATYHLYEAIRHSEKRPRVLFASTNHTIGYHSVDTVLDGNSPTRPDTLYGVSKVCCEQLAQFYFDAYGIETVSVRIGSLFAEPLNHRMLTTWMSPRDFASLCMAVFDAPVTGCFAMYGGSKDSEKWWSNEHASVLNWAPQDSTEQWQDQFSPTGDPDSLANRFQGGEMIYAAHPTERHHD
ncbi:MAG: NAD(P)-dependent oxidoreductase [Gammaproteobacteria bacterium]|nr:NAD(P)-dependent oxidoreductase [Gammaproteobacteria bacterium]